MSSDVQIFHNPSCSKSRGALSILEEQGEKPDVIKYLDTPPDRATLERILDAIDDEPSALVRAQAIGILDTEQSRVRHDFPQWTAAALRL